jgi:hypothetical protein
VPGADTAFTAEETLSRRRALRSYTINNAYAAFTEDRKGTLTPGKYADIAVLSDNLLEVPSDSIRSVDVDATIVGGEVAYER